MELETLKTQLTELRRDNVSLRNANGGTSTLSSGAAAAGEVSSLREQLSKLSTENAKLKSELSAFDLDFFEEIENLKYSHAEAVRKLKAMEKMYGPAPIR
jgi:predicted  nucleic acid-binding Zn-ribbon protein